MTQAALSGAGINTVSAVLKISGLNLLLQQGDIRTLESASDVDVNDCRDSSVGWINYLRQRWPVYCFSTQFVLLSDVPVSSRTCVLLAVKEGYIGVLCDDVSIMKQVVGQSYEVPVAMRLSHTPIQSLLVNKDGLFCISNAKKLVEYIENLALNKELLCHT